LPSRYLGMEPAGMVSADWDEAGCSLTIIEVADSLG